ncbi:homoserine dehydrogenase [Terriglobus roseus]|uniref:Homoserine dehydrogenase n=1 Tax=Terriglobus roseus TaxID=392734 RepID=A0A1H4KQ11_9BACT|nr:homoserine dehydrogenase [Terriglobus roseus]SEB60614.1 homoserine dehydrogenase [Terriglobus roseus]
MATTAKKVATTKTTRVAILGFGNVGSSVAQLLRAQRFAGIELTHIYNRDVERKRTGATAKGLGAGIVWTENIKDVLSAKVDVIIETIGGIDPIEGWLKTALKSGKHVVTANKQLIAYKGAGLARLARDNKRVLVYNAAVAGGVPVIPATLHGLQGDRITRLSGILNGTCNFMLSHMEQGAEYADVLKQAQAAGYAEADPSADVDGFDARAKLCILVRAAMQFGMSPDEVPAQTIRNVGAIDFAYAKELGCTVRQIARAEYIGTTLHARVAPMLVPKTSPIAWSHGTQNMVVTTGDFGGDVVFSGHGAGGNPTAVAIVSDLLAVVHGSNSVSLPVRRKVVTGEFLAPHYLRFIVRDKPGIVSAISGALTKVGANIDSILQRPGYPKDALPFVVTTEPCLTSTVEKAVRLIAKMDTMLEKPLCLQMLTESDRAED